MMRREGRLVVGASIKFDLAPKVKIGLSASNISAKPFIAQFENFALFNSRTQMDAIFGDRTK
jgi:hypothetical protein